MIYPFVDVFALSLDREILRVGGDDSVDGIHSHATFEFGLDPPERLVILACRITPFRYEIAYMYYAHELSVLVRKGGEGI